MLNLELPENVDNRLKALAEELGRDTHDLILEAVFEYLEDFEDIKVAQKRLANPPERYIDLDEAQW